jgi:hypothetical protein
MPRDRFCLCPSDVAEVASAIDFGVAVEKLTVKGHFWYSHAIAKSGYRSEIEDKDKHIISNSRFSHKSDDASLVITEIDPLETLMGKITFMNRSFNGIDGIEVTDKFPKLSVWLIL